MHIQYRWIHIDYSCVYSTNNTAVYTYNTAAYTYNIAVYTNNTAIYTYNTGRLSDDELSLQVDDILSVDDLSANGYIDYPEYIVALRRRMGQQAP